MAAAAATSIQSSNGAGRFVKKYAAAPAVAIRRIAGSTSHADPRRNVAMRSSC